MRRLWLIFSQAATVALAVLFVVGALKPQWLTRDGQPFSTFTEVVLLRTAPPPAGSAGVDGEASAAGVTTNAPATAPQSVADAARLASPAVVSVSTGLAASAQAQGEDPAFPFLFGDRNHPHAQKGFGSGVIVSPEGVLLTNNHVVAGAQEITVRLSDGRETRAKVVGTDPDTDLAVLRISLDKLPSITLGRMDALQVGDTVLAIGNPFNVGQTVTAGIVSALGRDGLRLSTFESFIQTDAAINPGNSGGALVNAQGQLVGINTAIYSRSGGSLGIGFAIPVDVAQQVMESLLRDGQVTRGWIGVEPRTLVPEFVDSLKLPVSEGVLITGVLQDGPAMKGGMRPGDVVVAVAGRPVASVAQLLNAVAALKPGSVAQLDVQRGNNALPLMLTVAKRPAQVAQAAPPHPAR